MPVLIDYILKLSICLAVVYLFYQLFLRRLTFYMWNRWYLMGYTALSFIIPFIDVMPELQKKQLDQNALVQMIPVFGFSPVEQMSILESLSGWDWVMIVGGTGSFILLIRFCIKFYSLLRIKKSAQLLSDADTKIYQLENKTAPFSFGNAIFINTDLHTGEELEEIIRHEFVHVRQKHTVDLLWSELLCILLWFNPFVWLLRHSIKQNLEFLADKQVLQNGLDKKEYQYLLLKVMGNKQFAFTHHFNFSSLKNRIAMMNTIKSAKVHLTRFAFLVPVIAILLLSFRNEIKEKTAVEVSEETKALGSDPLPSAEQKVAAKLRDTIPQNKKEIRMIPKDGSVLRLKNVKEGEEPLYVIDGVVQKKENSDELKNMNPDAIEHISILKGGSATSLYGEEAKHGAIILTTKKNLDATKNMKADPQNKTTQSLQGKVAGIKTEKKDSLKEVVVVGFKSSNGLEPLFLVNGIKQSSNPLGTLNPQDIESIAILKGDQTKVYGSEGKNGVIKVVTKKNASNVKPKALEIKKKKDDILRLSSANRIAKHAPGVAGAKNEQRFTGTANSQYRINPFTKKSDDPIMVFRGENNQVKASKNPSVVFKGNVKGTVATPQKNSEIAMVFKANNNQVAMKTGETTIIADTIFVRPRKLNN